MDISKLSTYTISTDNAHTVLFDFDIKNETSVESALKKLNIGRIDGFIFADVEVDPILKQLNLTQIKREFYKLYHVHAYLLGPPKEAGRPIPVGTRILWRAPCRPRACTRCSRVYYSADKLNDNDGDELPIGFDLSVAGAVFRFVHTTEMNVLGASVAWHVIVPLLSVDVEINALSVDESTTALGDIEFSPFILGWHLSKNLHMIATIDFMVPTGKYDENDASSPGRNYLTIDPIYAVTYLSDGGFELSGKFQYLINLENSDTDYTSGHEFICDYMIGQHFGPWNVGLNGYIYKQVTDDDQNGNTVNDNKGQCISVGPAVQYNYKNMFFNAKLQFDTMVENRPEGYKLWLKYMYAF